LAETGTAPARAGKRGAPAHLGARDGDEEDPLAEALVGEGADGVDAAGDEGRGVEVVGEERVVLLLHIRVALRDAPCTRDGKGGRRGSRHAEGAGGVSAGRTADLDEKRAAERPVRVHTLLRALGRADHRVGGVDHRAADADQHALAN
jgi:hypothetical protein